MLILIMLICLKLFLESGLVLGILSMCLKTGIIFFISMIVSFKEGLVLKGNF